MGKVAFIFSGQGSQYVGMGRELYDNMPVCKEVFEAADNALGYSISDICFEGPKEELDKTENTQPAVVAVSIAALKALEANGIRPVMTAGFSLGEYSALVCSGVFYFEQAIQLVQKRGRFMQEAVPFGVGTMAAILGLQRELVIECCSIASDAGIVEAVNFNCPGQIVIAGEVKAVEKAAALAKEKGALKTVMLAVSAPFHSSMLISAAERLEKELLEVALGNINVPLLTNVNGDFISNCDEVKSLLKKQAMSPVLWENIINRMLAEGVDTFVELGPGKTLSGFVKKIDRKCNVLNVEDMKSLEKAIEVLKNI